MNVTAIRYIALAFSMKQEIKIIFLTLIAVCLLPVIAVFMLTQVGIDAVSGVLVSNDPQTTQVDIHDPATGAIIDHVETSVMWPINGPVTLEFGQVFLPYDPFHTGIDIASPNHEVGDPVGAFMAGKVIYAGETSWGFGKHVEIDNGHHITSIYAHLDSIAVQEGDEVVVGTIIGARGNTGWSTGPHLHFEIKVFGIPVNPRVFLTGDPPANPPQQIINSQS
ncbi:MAG: M23 family metallopeptidase [Patescibacteria group bacterium]